jgi:uncharacterized protein (DUF433 family)
MVVEIVKKFKKDFKAAPGDIQNRVFSYIIVNFTKNIFAMNLDRITFDPQMMGGKPCLRGMRVTVGTIVGLVATGITFDKILIAYPYLEMEDIKQALSYAAWRSEEIEMPFQAA